MIRLRGKGTNRPRRNNSVIWLLSVCRGNGNVLNNKRCVEADNISDLHSSDVTYWIRRVMAVYLLQKYHARVGWAFDVNETNKNEANLTDLFSKLVRLRVLNE